MELTPENRSEVYRALMNNSNNIRGFVRHNNIRITRLEEHYAEGELTVTEASLNRWGSVHGGCLVALADTVGGVAATTTGKSTVTLSNTFNFLRPASGARIKCTAQAVKVGKTIAVFRCTLTDDRERVVANGDFTFFFTGDNLDKLLENATEE